MSYLFVDVALGFDGAVQMGIVSPVVIVIIVVLVVKVIFVVRIVIVILRKEERTITQSLVRCAFYA